MHESSTEKTNAAQQPQEPALDVNAVNRFVLELMEAYEADKHREAYHVKNIAMDKLDELATANGIFESFKSVDMSLQEAKAALQIREETASPQAENTTNAVFSENSKQNYRDSRAASNKTISQLGSLSEEAEPQPVKQPTMSVDSQAQQASKDSTAKTALSLGNLFKILEKAGTSLAASAHYCGQQISQVLQQQQSLKNKH